MRKPIVYYRGALLSTEQRKAKTAYYWCGKEAIKVNAVLAFNPSTGGFETRSTIYLPKRGTDDNSLYSAVGT